MKTRIETDSLGPVEVAEGKLDSELPLVVGPTGSGTHIHTRSRGRDGPASGSSAATGSLELHLARSLAAHASFGSVRLLADAVASVDARCVAGVEPDRARTAAHVDASLLLATALAPHVGYDAAARVAREADVRGTTMREADLALGVTTAAPLDELCRPERVTRPGRP